jgi:WD40 repeat protein/tRNA A-37 threonylcarbamoyl transferase component Bud32
MSGTERQGDDDADLPWTLLTLLERACDRFEAAWRDGRRPRMEDYLTEMPEAGRAALLRAMRSVERAYQGSDEARTIGQPTGPDGGEAGAAAPARSAIAGYEVLGELGRGGMGVVYKARQIRLNRSCALKMILAGDLAGARDTARFLAEAAAAARLRHPHIVQVYALGEHDGRPYLELEYLEGGSLAKWLDGTPWPPHRAAELIATLAGAVEAMHARGIVHRDLKPSNILLEADGTPKVADFGLAKALGADSGLTRTEEVLGTPGYMAPEQARGEAKQVGPAADVYALGAILYELITGRPPFRAATVLETLELVRSAEPVPPRRLVPRLPRDLETIGLKCLAKEPTERYPTAGALAADLGRFVAGEPVSVRAPGVVERAAKWARRKPTLAAAYTLGLLAALLGGLGGTAVWQWRAAERARDSADSARREAVAARDAERKAREQLAAVEYGRTIEVAHQKWRENKVAAALALLDSTRADLRGWEWRYVHRLCHSDLLTLKGHTDDVFSASFSRDGSRIVTGSWDATAKVWDARTGAEILTLKGHNEDVRSASFSPDGSRIITGSSDGTAKVWDARNGAELLTLKGHTGGVWSASFSPDGSRVLTANLDGTAKVWDAKTGAVLLSLNKVQTVETACAAFSPDGSRIVTVTGDKTAKVWDAKTGAEVLTLKGHADEVWSASFSPDGSRIVTASSDETAKVWDAKSGAELLTLKGHTQSVNVASFSRDGSRIVTSSPDKTARVWDARTGAEVLTLRGHTEDVWSASFSPDGSRVVTSSGDKTAKVWDAKTGAEVLKLKGHTDDVFSASFSPDGSRVVTSFRD